MRRQSREPRPPEWVIHSTFVPRRDGPRRLEQAFQVLLGSPPGGRSHLNTIDRGAPIMRAAIYARVSTEKQGRDQTIDSQLDGPPPLGRRPRPRTQRRARLHRRGLLRVAARPPGPRPPPRRRPRGRVRRRRASTAPTGWPAATPTRSSCWRSSAGPAARSSSSSGRSPTTRTTSSCSRSRGPIAEYERAVLGERFRRGKLQKARAGHWIAGQAPYGYRYVPKRDGVPAHLVVDEAEAEVVRMLYRWLIDERMTVRQILKRLAAGPWRPRSGKRLWSNSVVHRILSDPLYTGTALRQPARLRRARASPGRPAPGPARPTCRRAAAARGVDPDPGPGHHRRDRLIKHASDQLARNSALSFRNNTRNDYLLRCLLTCRTCGLAMFGVTTQRRPAGRRAHRYYKCHGKDTVARDRACRCPQTPAKVEELDAAVWGHVKAAARRPGHAGRAVRGAGPAGRRARRRRAARRARSGRPSCDGSTARSNGCSTPTRPR